MLLFFIVHGACKSRDHLLLSFHALINILDQILSTSWVVSLLSFFSYFEGKISFLQRFKSGSFWLLKMLKFAWAIYFAVISSVQQCIFSIILHSPDHLRIHGRLILYILPWNSLVESARQSHSAFFSITLFWVKALQRNHLFETLSLFFVTFFFSMYSLDSNYRGWLRRSWSSRRTLLALSACVSLFLPVCDREYLVCDVFS